MYGQVLRPRSHAVSDVASRSNFSQMGRVATSGRSRAATPLGVFIARVAVARSSPLAKPTQGPIKPGAVAPR
jgi:hypothetical protein